MKPHPEVLGEAQVALLRRLGPRMAKESFYLGGGTAVALHLGHRRSADLDWFTENRLGDALQLAQTLRSGGGLDLEVVETAPGTLHGRAGGVRVSFLEYGYPLLAPASTAEGLGAPVASLKDLAAMKVAVVAQRGARRDFIDLHALTIGFRPLQELLDLYRKKYGVKDIAHVLFGLCYFDDAEKEQMPEMLHDIAWEAVKADLRAQVKELSG